VANREQGVTSGFLPMRNGGTALYVRPAISFAIENRATQCMPLLVRTIGFGRLNNMRSLVKATLLAATFLATGTVINAQVSIGVVIAPPPPARVVVVLPERPAPEFVWVEGYWYPVL
jgi:hypothetical protein